VGRTPFLEKSRLTVEGVEGFFEATVTPIATGAKIGCPKRFLGREVFVIVRFPTEKNRDPAPQKAAERATNSIRRNSI
jgi:putative transposon-encoded protein